MPYIPNLTQEQYDMTQPNGVGTNAVYDQDIFRSILVKHWANQIPELQDFIRGWVAKLNDPNFLINDPASLFQMELEQQDWWTDRSQAWRDYDMMKIQDPETWAKNLELETQHVKDVLKSGFKAGADGAYTSKFEKLFNKTHKTNFPFCYR